MVMFSLRGEKEGEWGERKEGKDERMTGLGFCEETESEESEEGSGRRKGGMGHGGVTGRGREGRMKGPTGTERRRGPAWSRQSAVSL